MRQRAALSWTLWAIAFAGLFFCMYRYAVLRPARGRVGGDLDLGLLLFCICVLSCGAEFFCSRLSWFHIALALRLLSSILLVSFVAGALEIEAVLYGTILVEVAVYEPYPRNAAFGAGFFACVLASRLFVYTVGMYVAAGEALLEQVGFAFIGLLVLLPAILFTKYREDIITIQREKRRLDEMIVQIAKANLQYQSSAAEASEAGMRDERLRITREIHDVVGYTLTNNIAMMEAATDMIRRNPLGVPALINAARDNAKEGLQQIRAALYQLRAQGDQAPAGLRALLRLCRVFERATRISVTLAYGNARWEYGESVDSVIHHLVQEALLNAFRHGKATRATVALSESEAGLSVAITDDGRGAESYTEGIGLRGMRERVEGVGGELSITARPGLFSVEARLPLQGASSVR